MADIQSLFAQIRALADRQRRATSLGTNGFPRMGRAILQVLNAHGSLTVPHIARLCCTSRQNIQMWVNRLKASGHVDFISNPAHKKSDLVRLTETGRVFSTSLTEREAELLELASSRVSQAEVLSVTAVLRRIEQLLSADPKLPEEAAGSSRKARQAIRRVAPNRRKIASPKSKPQSVETPGAAPQGSPAAEEEFPLNLL